MQDKTARVVVGQTPDEDGKPCESITPAGEPTVAGSDTKVDLSKLAAEIGAPN